MTELYIQILTNEIRISNQLKLIEMMRNSGMVKANEYQKLLERLTEAIFNGQFNEFLEGEK